MSAGSSTTQSNEALAYLEAEASACWNKLLNTVFEPTAFTCEADSSAEPADCIWFQYDFTPQLGYCGFGLNRRAAINLGHRLLSAKSRASDHEHHAIHATSHLIGQLTASLATTLSDKLKTAVGSAESLNAGEISASAYTFAVAFREMEQDPEFLFIRPSSELLCLLDGASSISVVSDPSASPSTTRNLELLLDVEMPVSISLGSTRLLLKDIAQLSTGSIIELNRSISEPVQLVVNNFPIARADVVVVDGKFGVRIKEIVSRHDRLRSLT